MQVFQDQRDRREGAEAQRRARVGNVTDGRAEEAAASAGWRA